MPEKYRLLVAVQYLNASDLLFAGLKRQQGNNNFHFVVTMRSFIEYTRRGIWFLAWATDEQVQAVKENHLRQARQSWPGKDGRYDPRSTWTGTSLAAYGCDEGYKQRTIFLLCLAKISST